MCGVSGRLRVFAQLGNPVIRTVLAKNVATANEGPSTHHVRMHNEVRQPMCLRLTVPAVMSTDLSLHSLDGRRIIQLSYSSSADLRPSREERRPSTTARRCSPGCRRRSRSSSKTSREKASRIATSISKKRTRTRTSATRSLEPTLRRTSYRPTTSRRSEERSKSRSRGTATSGPGRKTDPSR